MVALALHRRAARADTDESEAVPFAGNLARVPVGTWATYRVSHFGGNGANDTRLALIRRAGKSAVWELQFPGPEGAKVVAQLTTQIEAGAPGKVTERLSRVGERKPEVPPVDKGRERVWFRVAPQKDARGEVEQVTVPAGRYRCQRFTQSLGEGVEYTFWTGKVFPTGVVKFQKYFTGGNGVRTVQETWELVAQGRGAKSALPMQKQERP